MHEGMRPHEELLWQLSGNLPASKKQKLEPTPQGCCSPVPMQGPFTDVPLSELYATEPSTGRRVVAMHSPVLQSPLQSLHKTNIVRQLQPPRIDPEPRIDARNSFATVQCASDNPMPYRIMAYAPPDSNLECSGNEGEYVAPEDVASNVSTRAHYDNEDTVTLQFSSICSPFLATTHVPCSQAGHIRTTPH